jgi:hypothetical protein
MPPRRSARVAAVAEQRTCAFPQLPLAVELRIFSLVPADSRLRCAEVARGWRATVAQPALWSRVDLSAESGVAQPASAGLLQAAVARAGGALTVLDVSGSRVGVEDLCTALRAAGSVEEVHAAIKGGRASVTKSLTTMSTYLAAAPRLRDLFCDLSLDMNEVSTFVAANEEFALLRVQMLTLVFLQGDFLSPAVTVALRDARFQPSLSSLAVSGADFGALSAMDVLADTLCARQRLEDLFLINCKATAASMPALVRAMSCGGLTKLAVLDVDLTFLDASGAAALGSAIRACGKLEVLSIWHSPRTILVPGLAALLGALVGLRSLTRLSLCRILSEDNIATGAALAALLLADTSALELLHLGGCCLGEAGLGPLCDALPSNHHIRELDIRDNNAPPGFMRSRLLPAVRANISLLTLIISPMMVVSPGAFIAEDDAEAALEALGIVGAR